MQYQTIDRARRVIEEERHDARSRLSLSWTIRTLARSSQFAATRIVFASPGRSFPKPDAIMEGVTL